MGEAQELYNITATEALQGAIDAVMSDHPEITKAQAKRLVLNTLLYQCVVSEIRGQVDFLLGICE